MKSVAVVILLVASVFGVPSSLIEDVKIAKMSPSSSTDVFLPNKVKRAQEEFIFGEPSQMPISELNKFQRETRYPRNYKKEMGDMRFYSSAVDQRIKRAPMKRRSIPRVRSKRDSEIDPKDLLLLLALWEGKLGLRGKNRGSWNNYLGELNDGDWNENAEEGSQLSDIGDPRNGEWLDGPVIPSVHQTEDGPPENHWDFNYNNHKRFMVSKRYQNRDEGVPHFYDNQFWDNVPVYRRMVL